METQSESGDLERRLTRMLGPVERIAPLQSGAVGRSFRVDTAQRSFVAKRFGSGASYLLGPEAQFELLGALAREGIAPAPVGVDPRAGLLVTAHIADGTHPTAAELRRPGNIARVAGLLRQLHDVPIRLEGYAPLDYAGQYLGQLGGPDMLAADDRARYAELTRLACGLTSLARRLDAAAGVVCHNDLTAENIFFRGASGGGSPMLIDFDFAVMGPSIVDLASLAAMNRFGSTERELLLEAYYGGKAPFGDAEFARVERLQHLLAHFWSLAAAGAGAASVGQYRIKDG